MQHKRFADDFGRRIAIQLIIFGLRRFARFAPIRCIDGDQLSQQISALYLRHAREKSAHAGALPLQPGFFEFIAQRVAAALGSDRIRHGDDQ